MVDDAGSQRSDKFFGRHIVPVQGTNVSANESLVVNFYRRQIISVGKRPSVVCPLRSQLEQRLGVFQVDSVEALGEPVADVREHRARFVATTGMAKEACTLKAS
jgi:hypothetical protein